MSLLECLPTQLDLVTERCEFSDELATDRTSIDKTIRSILEMRLATECTPSGSLKFKQSGAGERSLLDESFNGKDADGGVDIFNKVARLQD